MPKTIVDVDSFDTVTAPDDGDPANGATFQLAPQALANRTRYLLENAVTAPAPVTYTRMIPVSRAVPASGSWSCDGSDWSTSNPAGGVLSFATSLPHGVTITQVRVGATQGAAAGVGLKFAVYISTPDKTGTVGVGATTQLGTTQTIAGTGPQSPMSVSGLSHVFDAANELLQVAITASNSGSSSDIVYWAEVTYTSTDPKAGVAVL